jgi:hypothetical protein
MGRGTPLEHLGTTRESPVFTRMTAGDPSEWISAFDRAEPLRKTLSPVVTARMLDFLKDGGME